MKRISAALAACVLAALIGGSRLSIAETTVEASRPVPAITKPSADVTLKFTHPGRIAETRIKEGDTVKPDQVLVKLDDAEEQAALASDKAKADDVTKIEAQKAMMKQKEIDAEKMEDGFKRGAVSEFERDEAKVNVVVAAANVKLSEFEREQAVLKYQQTRIAVMKMELRSPIAGKVEELYTNTGESVDPQTKVLRVVNVDPLWVDVPVPYAQAATLKNGETARVTFSDKTSAAGKVVLVSDVGDAASGTLRVRLEIANKDHRRAGERVSVDFGPAKVAQK